MGSSWGNSTSKGRRYLSGRSKITFQERWGQPRLDGLRGLTEVPNATVFRGSYRSRPITATARYFFQLAPGRPLNVKTLLLALWGYKGRRAGRSGRVCRSSLALRSIIRAAGVDLLHQSARGLVSGPFCTRDDPV